MFLGVNAVCAAVLAIDLHRGHLDPDVATMPLTPTAARAVIGANRRFFDACRQAHIPVMHLLTCYRSVDEIRSNPFWRTLAEDPAATRRHVLQHNLWDGPGVHVMPELHDARDWVIQSKRRYDGFIGSEVEFALQKNGINTLLITGVNTNSCVLATAASACCRDFAVIVIEDCVDTIDGRDAHTAALHCIRTAFGWVMTGQNAIAQVTQPSLG